MPMLNDSSSCISDANKLAERRKEEKDKFDARHQHELKPLIIGSTVSFLNSDLKTWSMVLIHGRSTDNRSYEILTENGDACKNAESVMAPKSSPVPNKPPTTNPHVTAIKGTIGSSDNCYRTLSGRIVQKL